MKIIKQPRITKPQRIAKSCGHYAAARYLANRGYTLDQALILLFGIRPIVPVLLQRQAY